MNKENQKIIVQLLADGKTVKQIAGELNMNCRTLEGWIYKLRKNHKCDNVTQLAVKILSSNKETED